MRIQICTLACLGPAFLCGAAMAQSPVTGGSGTMKFDLPTLLGQTPLGAFDAVFGITETYDELLSLPGNGPGSTVAWDFNPIGTPSPMGRLIQATSLDIDPTDVLATWGPASSDNGAFVKGGEQIGFGGMTRWTFDPPIEGPLLMGDWAVRFSTVRKGTFAGLTSNIRSGLVITSNIDFPDASFVDIGNASINVTGSTITITGDLLISDALIVLGFPFETLGLDIGDVTLIAKVGSCHPDCDGSGQLNIDDFICFQTLFAMGDPAADCDASGTLDIDDFICFQTLFALGC